MNAIASFTPPATLGAMLAALGTTLLAPDANSRASLSRCWRDLRIAQREAAQTDEPAVARALGHLAAGLQHLAAEGSLPADGGLRAAAHACTAMSAWVTDRDEQHAAEVLLALSAVDWLHDYRDDDANALALILANASVSAPAVCPMPVHSAHAHSAVPPQADGDATDSRRVQLCLAERELIQQAIGTQVLPALSGRATPDALSEIGFNLSLIANALAAIGLDVVAELTVAVATALADPASLGASADTLEALAEYFCAATPDPDIMVARVARHSRIDWPSAHRLAAELRRVEFCDEPAASAVSLVLSAADLDLSPATDVLPNVLASMLRELPQHAQQLGDAIRAAIEGDRDAMEAATRIAHTLKGDANTVGIRGLAHLTHVLEDALLALARAPDSSSGWSLPLQSAADLVEEIADHLGGHAPAPLGLESAYNGLASLLLQPPEADLTDHEADAGARQNALPVPAARPSSRVSPVSAAPPEAAPVPVGSEMSASVSTLSIDTELLDHLQKLSAELLVLSRQLEQQLGGLSRSFNDLTREIKAEQSMVNSLDDLVSLRGAALRSASLRAGAEMDALEMDQYTELHGVSRRIMEANTDHQTLAHAIQAQLRQIEDMRSLQEQVNNDLNRLVQRARALPFRDIGARLQRVVRQTARALGKEARLDISGGDTLIDAEALQALVEPLSHALRNALDHGIEPAELRLRRGKPAAGVLRVAARPVGDLIAIEIEDDGNGLDEAAILGRARAAGLIDAQTPSDPNLIARLVSRPGFTTRDEVTQTSGRGVGMDVIARRIQGLRGQLALHSLPARGTRLELRIPASQALVNVAVARGGDLVLAIAADAIEQVVSMNQLELEDDAEGQSLARFGEARLLVIPMEALGGDDRAIPVNRAEAGMALLVRSQDGRRLVTVDAVEEIGKVIVKPLSVLLPPIPAVRGICQLGDGRLAPVVDIDQLLEVQRSPTALQRADAPAGPPCIVVADDSLSVRRALEQLLQDAGFRVSVARDGLEAINQILALRPAAVLLDLEMPKMNGLEVTRFLRTHEALAQTPVVMVTSRASGKYQVMANEAGVDRLVGKPYSEDQLVTTVRELLAAASV